ncbi:E3 ubiquitin-protein ligase RNF13 [Orchesella cincta]|uniref:E3 ubiquitin-protein ligase RNF13 n=1 Tax=Orchesella cincta TaxID=48709 RepID=A0A1D2NE16_ORCCI|nr:E3 ubiquitin-protein ligase RNF13 [Orchesella cincta]
MGPFARLSAARYTCIVLILSITTIVQTEGRIVVLSAFDDETVYVVREKAVVENTDSPSKGMLILSMPVNACKPVVPSPPIPINATGTSLKATTDNATTALESVGNDSFGWILLVSWSPENDCSLRTKAEHAINAGYAAILLQDPSAFEIESEPLSPLSALTATTVFDYGWTDVGIYACTIDPEDWNILRRNFTNDDYYLSFEDSSSMSGWFTYFIVGVLAIGAVFFTIGLSYVLVQLLVLILLWIRESIVSRIQQVRRDRRRRLPASQLRKIPIQQWNSDMLQDICSICLETFIVHDRVRILPCSHVFHQACLDPWLLKHRRKCPNCKRKIVFPDENRESDSSSEDERTPLLRRGSSRRESETRVSRQPDVVSQRVQTQNHQPLVSGIHRYLPPSTTASNNVSNSTTEVGDTSANPQLPSHDSSINTSTEVDTTSQNGDQPDLKDTVDHLCARMESVGRKIKKKVKAHQASKLENDSSSDLSTGIQPVLVAVTIESNNIPDTSDNEYPHTESQSHFSQQPSSSNNNAISNQCSTGGLEVKVVPEFIPSPSHTLTNSENCNNEHGESSISSDLNA